MRKLYISALFVLFFGSQLSGQGEIDEQARIVFRNEFTFGLILSTDGYGISYREGKRLDYFNRRLLEFDMVTLKHPKEVRLTNPAYQTPGSFIFGKKKIL